MIKGVNVRVDTTVLDAIRETARKSPTLMNTAYNRATRRLRTRMLEKLRTESDAVVYPIKWQTPKQRKAFFASNGFGKGIPSQRTGELEAGYSVEVRPLDENGAALEINNTAPHAQYVSGAQVQRMHVDRWVQVVDVAIDYEAEANDVLIETWFTVSSGQV